VLSCSTDASPSKVDSCCAETFGGLLLSTQFWDTYTGLESKGQLLPSNQWTLHGLWSDYCNASFPQYCDLNRQYDPTPRFVTCLRWASTLTTPSDLNYSPNTTNGLPNGALKYHHVYERLDWWEQVSSFRHGKVQAILLLFYKRLEDMIYCHGWISKFPSSSYPLDRQQLA